MHMSDIVLPNDNENGGIAPFVMKTYLMVSDPNSDRIVSWSRSNNSFIVADPLEFSTCLLPLNFKHNNFSSFVRQLNTYGFKKVDPDRWEFANEWFLRGQRHLLRNIVRRKHSPGHHQQIVLRRGISGGEAAEEGEMVREIERMKKEQSEMEKELEDMTRRLEATERRPDQMAAFLCRVVEDPAVLDRIVIERERICGGEEERKRRRIMMSPASGSGSGRAEEEECSGSVGAASSSPDAEDFGGGMEELVAMGYGNGGRTIGGGIGGFGGGVKAVGWGVEGDVGTKPPPYPFSLFSGGI